MIDPDYTPDPMRLALQPLADALGAGNPVPIVLRDDEAEILSWELAALETQAEDDDTKILWAGIWEKVVLALHNERHP